MPSNGTTRVRDFRPTIGITMGDPLGIGPEIIIKSLADPRVRRAARYVIYGLNELLTYAADQQEIDPFWFRVQHDSPRASDPISEAVVVLDYDVLGQRLPTTPEPSKAGGFASKTFVEDAITDALQPSDHPRHLDSVVTAPISKQSWELAGFRWPGHTELFAHRTKSKRTAMMFTSPKLNVVLATAHVPLMDVRNRLSIGCVHDPIDLGSEACKQIGIASPRIAVAGLNPHASENGKFGDEENRVIAPAIAMARQSGIDAHGPFPGDTIFNRAIAGEFDLVVAMYHDQGLIPVKLLCWDEAVNWTIGMPIIRTSPDHGTAFDIAGRNKASANSMSAAILHAARLAGQRQIASEGSVATAAQ